MIPKVIHYCWFGGNPIPKEYCRYMESWGRFMPDYEIKRWDENNFDVQAYPFTRKAYATGKMAFVSDYARLKILYENGGVYFDTDVEVLKSIDPLLDKGGFMGFEKNTNANAGDLLNVALGLGFAVEPKHPIIREIIEYYDTHVDDELLTIVVITMKILRKHGLVQSETPSEIDGIVIYPWDYFCPIEFMGKKLEITSNTYTIHHYSASWMSRTDKLRMLKGYYANKIRKLLNIRR